MTRQTQVRAQILKQAFDRARRQNKSFSLRALAQKLGVSGAFVSKVLNGKTDLPFERLNDFILHLKIDKISENRLLKSYSDAKTNKLMEISTPTLESDDLMKEYVEIGEKQFFLLTKWYLIPILDLSGCVGFKDDPEWVAQRMRLSVSEADQALRFLKAQNYLVKNDKGQWQKNEKHLRFPTKDSRGPIREYHEIMMKKAIQHLQTQTSQQDFDSRLISGIWIASNPQNFAKAMARLNEAMFEVAHILNTGDSTELYYLASQLFPVTKPLKN